MSTQVDLLRENKWVVFATEEPKGKIRRLFQVKFDEDKIVFSQTTLFSEAGLGTDLELEIVASVASWWPMNDGGTFEVIGTNNKSGTNDQSQSDTLFLNSGVKPFVVHWGGRQVTMFRRVWQHK